jgi:hypothetical protein
MMLYLLEQWVSQQLDIADVKRLMVREDRIRGITSGLEFVVTNQVPAANEREDL